MTSLISLGAGADAAEEIVELLLGTTVEKAGVNPLTKSGFLLISKKVAEKIRSKAKGAEAAAVREVFKELRFDWKRMSESQVQAALKATRDGVAKAYTRKVIPAVEAVLKAEGPKMVQATRKATIAAKKYTIQAKFGDRDRVAEAAVRKSQTNYIRNSAGNRVQKLSDKARIVVTRGIRDGLASRQIASDLQSTFSKNVPRPDSYWSVVAETFISRARVISQIGSLEDAGIETYQLVAVIDEVTTDICRMMDGKVFLVSHARGLINKLGELDNPEDVKYVQPWVRKGSDADGNSRLWIPHADGSSTTVATVTRSAVGTADDHGDFSGVRSDEELVTLGIPVPPFHGRCRTTIVAGPGG